MKSTTTMLHRFIVIIVFVTFSTQGFGSESAAKTPVADAAERQQWKTVFQLIEAGKNPSQMQPDGSTAIHWAAYHGHTDTVQKLLNAKANPDTANRYSITPLSIACRRGEAKIVNVLLTAGADVNGKTAGDETALMTAARTGDPATVRCLLKHGANLDVTERRGQTALMWAAAAGNIDAVDILLTAGAKPDIALRSGFTAMMFAVRQGHIDVVNRFLAAGLDVNAVMKPESSGARVPRRGTSALLMAVESGHFELAMFLVKHGADPNDQRNGYAPLHILAKVRKPDRGENPNGDPPPRGSGNLTALEFVRAIVAAGADVNLQLSSGKGGRAVLNPRGATPFLLASKTADLPYLQLLMELGADPHIKNADKCTSLMAAAGIGVRAVGEEAGTEPEVLEVVEFLLKHGADVNAVDDNKETAMHGAAYRCFPLVVDLLARRGADSETWYHKNKSGWTPVMIAQGHRPGSFKPSPETVSALRAAMND